MGAPQVGERWRHWKGGIYRIVACPVLLEGDGERGQPYVVYQSEADQRIWARPLADWTIPVTPRSLGEQNVRFEQIIEPPKPPRNPYESVHRWSGL